MKEKGNNFFFFSRKERQQLLDELPTLLHFLSSPPSLNKKWAASLSLTLRFASGFVHTGGGCRVMTTRRRTAEAEVRANCTIKIGYYSNVYRSGEVNSLKILSFIVYNISRRISSCSGYYKVYMSSIVTRC